ncbi:MAG: N-6 DNA methylase [Bryobacterales bacterium]|nr:N-6 DNA methylase [Bryobacterales bacterium]
MRALEEYLQDLHEIRSSGSAVQETSYYPALSNLMNAAGKTLKPRVRCVMNLRNRGAGMPDGGLFSADQIQRSSGGDIPEGTVPSRGVIEVKGTAEDAWVVADGKQVSRYWGKYRQVLVTNYRDFVLIGQDGEGNPIKLETYRLAPSEAEFWKAANLAQLSAQRLSESFHEFLKRVLLSTASLSSPEEVAWFLASYAREAKFRVEEGHLPALAGIRSALEEALGMKFDGQRGEHFFRSTLVQTLFYGMFSAWVLWSKNHPPIDRKSRFDWRLADYYLKVPIIRKLFREVADPGQLEPLNLPEVLDWACSVLNRVDRASFFTAFDEGAAVQYFYEPFLEAFDPELRKELGVWYTPREVVRYMVERVDRVLREQLKRPLGFADPQVYVLDPCCGTGAFLVEVLDRIARTLGESTGDSLVATDLKKAAIERVFGFELLPAPFVVSHLQIGLILQHHGAPLSEKKRERVGVYLTNALTGWEPPKTPKRLPFVELEEERDAADQVKREKPILVVIGNPPYNSFAGIARVEEERDLSTAYKSTKQAPPPQGQGLNDLYVRFYRMAERRIVEKTGQGITCFISNYSWLDGLSFTGMRERYLEAFDHIWIDCLNGDKYKTGKVTPEGEPDPSIFSTEFNREGIQVGTAIALMAKCGVGAGGTKEIQFRHLWGKNKRSELLESVHEGGKYTSVVPMLELGLPFVEANVGVAYFGWPSLDDLFPTSFAGVKSSRDDLVTDIDRGALESRMRLYLDARVSIETLRKKLPIAMDSTGGFKPVEAREALLKKGGFIADRVRRFTYRPFDTRWIYWEPEAKLLDRPRPEYVSHLDHENLWIEARQKQPMDAFDRGFVVRHLADNFGNGLSNFFPLLLHEEGNLLAQKGFHPNLSKTARQYLATCSTSHEHLFFHVIAVLQSPAYRLQNQGALRQDWPRIPLPSDGNLLSASAELGRQIAALFDIDHPIQGVTTGPFRTELQEIAVITRPERGSINPDEGDLDLTAGWGHAGKNGATMPGKGKTVERAYSPAEQKALGEAAEILGSTTIDVYLNERVCWRNVPVRLWDFTISGYAVIKKWLSYREKELLGRSLTVEEARYVTEMARRLAAIMLLGPKLDENYEAILAKGSYELKV